MKSSCAAIERELGAHHVGTYLHGSLAAGSCYPPKSDVDILFVVDGSLDAEARQATAVAAARMNLCRPMTGSLECSVVRTQALADRRHPMPFEVHFGEELTDEILSGGIDFEEGRTDSDLAAHVQAICEVGIVLEGPPISEVFRAPRREDFLDSIGRDLEWILKGENILESPYYCVLNVARILWVLERVSPRLAPSKAEAGEWLHDTAPVRHRDVVRLALDVYRDSSPILPAERRTGGRRWPREALLGFRDWARTRTDVSALG